MSNLNITDGEPITYDFLQQLASQVIALEKKISDNNTSGRRQRINVAGPGFKNINNITIICDSQNLEVDQKKTYNFNINFPAAAFSTVPHVVATIADTDDGTKKDQIQAPYATVSIGKVNKQSFKCRVDLIKADTKNTKIKVNYIAIGQASDRKA